MCVCVCVGVCVPLESLTLCSEPDVCVRVCMYLCLFVCVLCAFVYPSVLALCSEPDFCVRGRWVWVCAIRIPASTKMAFPTRVS